MRRIRAGKTRKPEAGVALLIALFALLLISAVVLSMVMASSTENSLAGNYRSSSSAYYAALAGLEEARGRLLPGNPNPIVSTCFPSGTIPIGKVCYITNPVASENVLTSYPDNEYRSEFGANPTTSNTVTVASVPGQITQTYRGRFISGFASIPLPKTR
jgi:Tfp pilus assembly protein PilX